MTEGIILVYSDLFDDKPRSTEEYLKGIGKDRLFQAAEHFLSFKNQGSEFEEIQIFINHFFCSENSEFKNDISQRVQTHQNNRDIPVTIVYPFSSLKLYEFAYNNVENTTTQSEVEIERNLFLGYLALNEEWFLRRNELAKTSTQFLPADFYPTAFYFSLHFPSWDLIIQDKRKYFIAQLCKAVIFFEYAETALQQVLKDFLEYFECADWKEFMKRVLDIPSKLVMHDNEGTSDFIVADDEQSVTNIQFLEKLSLTDEKLMEGTDFISLRNKPFRQIEPDKFRVINSLFVLDKIYKGLYFKFRELHKKSGSPLGDLRQKITSEFSEHRLLYEIIEFAFNKRFIQHAGKELAEKKIDGAPDYYLRNGRKILLFENKDILINAALKDSFDYNKYGPEIKKKLLDVGMRQLINSIRLICSCKCPFDDAIPKKNLNIYPILVLHDNLYNTPALNSIVNYHFQIELQKLQSDGFDICWH